MKVLTVFSSIGNTLVIFAYALNDNLSLKTYLQLMYDANPPETVPETMYLLRNGLSIAF